MAGQEGRWMAMLLSFARVAWVHFYAWAQRATGYMPNLNPLPPLPERSGARGRDNTSRHPAGRGSRLPISVRSGRLRRARRLRGSTREWRAALVAACV